MDFFARKIGMTCFGADWYRCNFDLLLKSSLSPLLTSLFGVPKALVLCVISHLIIVLCTMHCET